MDSVVTMTAAFSCPWPTPAEPATSNWFRSRWIVSGPNCQTSRKPNACSARRWSTDSTCRSFSILPHQCPCRHLPKFPTRKPWSKTNLSRSPRRAWSSTLKPFLNWRNPLSTIVKIFWNKSNSSSTFRWNLNHFVSESQTLKQQTKFHSTSNVFEVNHKMLVPLTNLCFDERNLVAVSRTWQPCCCLKQIVLQTRHGSTKTVFTLKLFQRSQIHKMINCHFIPNFVS